MDLSSGRAFGAFPELSAATLAVLGALGFRNATPVQEAVLPLFCGHKDVVVDACTGSGKTLAFVLPVIERLRRLEEPLRRHEVGALIVSPTRELARQTFEVLGPFVASVPQLTSLLLVGGSDPLADVARFEAGGGHALVGTPGRLADLLQRCKTLSARRLEVLVLDEADRLLDLGFKAHLDAIMRHLPRQRRTGLFSATQTAAVAALARAGLRNPVRVAAALSALPAPPRDAACGSQGSGAAAAGEAAGAGECQRTPEGLKLSYLTCEPEQKLPQLIAYLQAHRAEKAVAYVLTCACVDFYAGALAALPGAAGLAVFALHGRKKQAQREAVLARFRAHPAGVLLCTDVAARGLDIPEVGRVVQVDAPQNPDAFVHRVGRTARLGRRGAALALLLPHEAAYVPFLRRRKVPVAGEAAPAPCEDVSPALQAAAAADRAAMERGLRAFVSYVRGYQEHQCRFIFRMEALDLGRLAAAFGLLRLPAMPELAKSRPDTSFFTPSPVDPATVKYKDKAKEKLRQQRLAAAAAAAEAEEEAGGDQAAAPPAARARQPKPAKRAPAEKRLPAAKRRLQESRQDAEDFADDYRLLKKLKRGRMSELDYEVAIGLSRAADSKEAELAGEKGSAAGEAGEARSAAEPAPEGSKRPQAQSGCVPTAGKGRSAKPKQPAGKNGVPGQGKGRTQAQERKRQRARRAVFR